MSETTSAAEDFDGLELTSEEEEAGATIEINVPDSERDAMLAHIRVIADDSSELPEASRAHYNNWDEMAAVAELKETGGVWSRIKSLPEGSEVLVGDTKEFLREQRRLERAFRSKHPKLLKKDKYGNLPDLNEKNQTEILIVAAFKTGVLDWRGPGFCHADGSPVPFTAENFSLAMERFDELGVEVTNLMVGVNASALEQVRGN